MTTPSSNGKDVARTILFADNEPILLDAIPELLQTKGYEVHTTQDGLETLQAIRRLKPGYVILDIVMPKLDGSRVCWLIRQDPDLKNTPIIAFSTLSPEQIRRFPELSPSWPIRATLSLGARLSSGTYSAGVPKVFTAFCERIDQVVLAGLLIGVRVGRAR